MVFIFLSPLRFNTIIAFKYAKQLDWSGLMKKKFGNIFGNIRDFNSMIKNIFAKKVKMVDKALLVNTSLSRAYKIRLPI